MKLDQISAEIRPRSSWEAIDLGFQMARKWYKPMLLSWLLVSFPFLLLLSVLSFKLPWLGFWLFWWLKPLFERSQLYILSHGLFGELPSVRETVTRFRFYTWPQSVASIIWRRFSLTRSFDLAIVQLEELKGLQRTRRLGLLHRSGTGTAIWLTTLGFSIEVGLVFSFYAFVVLLNPQLFDFEWWDFLSENSLWISYSDTLVAYLCASVVAPFYVAAGFSLYLNRRSHLEAWDIEIMFRRLLHRVQQSKGKSAARLKGTNLLVVGFLVCFIPLASGDAYCDEIKETVTTHEVPQLESKSLIDQVVASELFHKMETQKRIDWTWLLDWLKREEVESKESSPSEWLKNILQYFNDLVEISPWVGSFFEVALWALLALLLFIVFWKYRHWSRVLRIKSSNTGHRGGQPKQLFGLELGLNSLPSDVVLEANRLAREANIRSALSLLYRGALSRFVNDMEIPLSDSDTEASCIKKIENYCEADLVDYFKALVTSWQRNAYGHMDISDEQFNMLCEGWMRHFHQQV